MISGFGTRMRALAKNEGMGHRVMRAYLKRSQQSLVPDKTNKDISVHFCNLPFRSCLLF